jgi:hypothetical protein
MDNGESRVNQNETKKVDTGLFCLVMVAGYHGLAVDQEQLGIHWPLVLMGWRPWIFSGEQEN